MSVRPDVQALVDLARERGGLGPDDVVAALVPLFRQVAGLHEVGLVAPLRGLAGIASDDRYRLGLVTPGTTPQRDDARVAAVQHVEVSAAVEVTGHQDAAAGGSRWAGDVLDEPAPADVVRPVHVTGWQTWDHVVGHHDALTDVASLGGLLCALTCGLDLAVAEDVERLAAADGNLFRLNPRIHPVVAQVAAEMVEPDRRRRGQDVGSLAERLEDYRDAPLDLDLAQVLAGAGAQADRRRAVLVTLRDRLFDLSRRNRLLHFRPSRQSLDLTEASVPMLLDVRNVRSEQLFTWTPAVAEKVLSGKAFALSSVLRWDDAPYAAAILDGIISQARRDRAEYGQAQLRLVVAFLRWHDLKGDVDERISSPLLLLPVTLTRRRGVRDSYVLHSEGNVAEVNPTLRQQLSALYDLDLPERVDLADDGVTRLHADLARWIAASEPAVTLTLQDRPRVALVRQRALVRLQAYDRAAGRSRMSVGSRSYVYSYRRRDDVPLGLQLFRDRVAHRPAPPYALCDVPVTGPAVPDTAARPAPPASPPASRPVTPGPPATAHTAGRGSAAYTLDRPEAGNPYAWDVDLCALTVANFNYRTMSLVRDFTDLVEGGTTCAAFDRVFSLEPRPLDPPQRRSLALPERYLVVPADDSQVVAVARAREGESFVIQGPPGTGKSQTITNLVADYVAAGKRVLFVCQKRAAIDVVHARLRRQGLDELTCLIHDSQADKKAFVHGLRRTYEAWLAGGPDLEQTEVERADVLVAIALELDRVRGYEAAVGSPAADGGPSPRELLERLVDLAGQRWDAGATPAVRRLLPTAGAWWAARPVVDRVAAALAAAGGEPVLATSPGRYLAPTVLGALRPDAEVAVRGPQAAQAVRAVVDALAAVSRPTTGDGVAWPDDAGAAAVRLGTAGQAGAVGGLVLPLAERGRAAALRVGTAPAQTLRTDAAAFRAAREAARQAAAAAAGWREPLAPDDARAALEVARAKEGAFLRLLSGAWRQVRSTVRERFDAGPRAVPLTVTAALTLLVTAQDAAAEVERLAAAAELGWGHRDPEGLLVRFEALRRTEDRDLLAVLDAVARDETGRLAAGLARAGDALDVVRERLDGLLVDVDDVGLGDLAAMLDGLADPAAAPGLRALAPALRALEEHPSVARALRRLPAPPTAVEHAVAAAALDDVRAQVPAVGGFDGADLAEAVGRVQELLPRLYACDAEVVVARVRDRFLAGVAHSARSVTGMTPTERAAKQAWSTGRRELEHEFGKVMRYRSIRELASGDPGAVVAALRPVWLMSPTSVSDTLPLDPSLFDVVVYDEASQIPVEEAVPAMHRAEQVVVVGDQMQLPPTQYFSTRPSHEPGDAGDAGGRDGTGGGPGDDGPDDERVGVVLDGDSFLAQSAVRLPSTMLTWHYRSRYEALIGFSNAAFYDSRLSTVPDRTVVRHDRPDVVPHVAAADDAGADALLVDAAEVTAGVDALLSRSISVHRAEGAVYRRRTNPGEAAYIAALVRELLARGTGLTIGVVAFSEAQQTAIDRALDRLAEADADFARRYEAEIAREDDDQFVGLFVKNLENVQGDERDIVLMSVCYAPGPGGRMVMNFGPINQRGGEKRLNVIFSRARRHMGIVTTIGPEAITNTYNDGASTLRRFLSYAQAVSRGDDVAAATALAALGSGGRPAVARGDNPVADQLAEALLRSGVEVARDVGASRFRCDLALRRPGEADHRVAVLVDTPVRTAAEGVEERVLSHPAVLRAAGWEVAHVLTKDWYEDPARVVATLTALVAP
jgi:hypothetical protein